MLMVYTILRISSYLYLVLGYLRISIQCSRYIHNPSSRYGPRMARQPPVRAATKKSDKFSFKFRRLDMVPFHLFFGLAHLLYLRAIF